MPEFYTVTLTAQRSVAYSAIRLIVRYCLSSRLPRRPRVVIMFGEAAMSIDSLRHKYPWPGTCPTVPEKWHGCLPPETEEMLKQHLKENTTVVVELGASLGLVPRAILETAPKATVICIGDWGGSSDHQRHRGRASGESLPYSTFLRNLWHWRDRVVPIRANSQDGLRQMAEARLVPELVYLDVDHTYESVSRELNFCTAHWPTATILGSGCLSAASRSAANEHANLTNRSAVWNGHTFCLPGLHGT
jgi:hypothetical protein